MAPQKRIPTPPPSLTPEDEILLWENKLLNLETSVGVIHAVIFYLIKCFGVCHGRYLKLLTTENVKYGEDDLGKYVTIDLTSAAKFGKVIRRYEDPQNPRSFYKIITTYQRHMTNEGPLLVRPISSIKDYVCYSPWQCGINMIDQIAQSLMKDLKRIDLYNNSSISMLSIDLLKNLGLGYHCMGTWRQSLFSCYRKDYYRLADDYDPCNMLNCEKKNLSLCLLVSRLLDPPYPSEVVELASERKLLLSELEKGKLDLKEVFKGMVIHFSEDNADIYRTDATVETSSQERPSSSLVFIQEYSSLVQRKKPSKKKSRAGSERQRTGRKRRKSSTPGSDKSAKVKSASGKEENSLKILAVGSISESSFSVQMDDGDRKPLIDGVVKIEEGTSEGKQTTEKYIKTEAIDENDDLPVTIIKKEIIKEEDCSSLDGLSVGFEKGEDELLGNIKIDCDLIKQNIDDCSDTCLQDDCLIIDDTLEGTAGPSPPVDSLHLLRKLLENSVVPSEEIPACQEDAGAVRSAEADLSPPKLSPQPKVDEGIEKGRSCTLDMSQQGAGQQQAFDVISLPNEDSSCQVQQEVGIPSDSVYSNKLKETSITDIDKESLFVLSKFPPAQSMTNSASIDNNFPTLRLALESRAHYQGPHLANACYDEPEHVFPKKLPSHSKTLRKLRALKRCRSSGNSVRRLTNFKRRHKLKAGATSNARHLPLPNGQSSNSAYNDISGCSSSNHSLNATLLNSPLAELKPHSGLYHMTSDQEKQSTYQTVKIRTDCGTKLFTIGDLHMEKTSSSVMLTSETNIGDYFPEGTMIPANGLKLLTRNGSNGLEVLLKFDYINGASHVNNSN